jgi:hypothetical protein
MIPERIQDEDVEVVEYADSATTVLFSAGGMDFGVMETVGLVVAVILLIALIYLAFVPVVPDAPGSGMMMSMGARSPSFAPPMPKKMAPAAAMGGKKGKGKKSGGKKGKK